MCFIKKYPQTYHSMVDLLHKQKKPDRLGSGFFINILIYLHLKVVRLGVLLPLSYNSILKIYRSTVITNLRQYVRMPTPLSYA
jgi:hypothetical protein